VPAPEEVKAFVNDKSPKAYEKLVDRLLASPHFGERWASMWLDLARYADSKGYEADRDRPGVWPYRDWVIDAINRNLPYDQFVIKQLAGDLLPHATFEDRIATSFHRQTPNNDEGGTDDEEFRMVAVMDRVATTWSVLNGLTMNCVQCHSHPYDPIRHTDYYKSMAFFNTQRDADLVDDSPTLRVPKEKGRYAEAAQIQQQIAGLLQPSSGSVKVFGHLLSGINSRAGYMFQAEALMPWRNAVENVAAGLEFRGVGREQAAERAREWLKRVGLGGFEKRFPHQLSGGMRKRVALAQMLILDPQILLMDEPFSALDIQTRQLMENELLELWGANRKSVVFITHDLEEAISLSDRVVVLSAGPESHEIGNYPIDLPRPRDVAEIRLTPRFIELHGLIWHTMKEEVLKSYARQQKQ